MTVVESPIPLQSQGWFEGDCLESPLWSKVDGPLWKVREWAQQFY